MRAVASEGLTPHSLITNYESLALRYNKFMFGKLRRLILILCVADALGTQLALLAADSLRRFLPLPQTK